MSKMNELIRKDINKIMAYVPGKPIDLAQRQLKIKEIIKLNSNENAFGASLRAKSAIKKNLDNIFRYPDGSCYYLKKRLSKKLGLKPENLTLGNGSDEIIDIIVKTFLNRGQEIITSKITFVEYEIIAKANGFKPRTIPQKNFGYDLDKIRKNITKDTKIVFIANPNNPTGSYVSHTELLQFINKLPKDKLAVVDEAYVEFVDARDFPKLLNYIHKANLIILRTFSKAYGLAGLRIGYAIARPEFIKAMEKIRQPFNVNSLAQRAAEAALKDKTFINKSSASIIKEKYRLYKEFETMGIKYTPSQANFIMFRTSMDGLELCKKMLKRGILIRDLKQYNLDKYIRVTIGEPKENNIFIQNLKMILEEEK